MALAELFASYRPHTRLFSVGFKVARQQPAAARLAQAAANNAALGPPVAQLSVRRVFDGGAAAAAARASWAKIAADLRAAVVSGTVPTQSRRASMLSASDRDQAWAALVQSVSGAAAVGGSAPGRKAGAGARGAGSSASTCTSTGAAADQLPAGKRARHGR